MGHECRDNAAVKATLESVYSLGYGGGLPVVGTEWMSCRLLDLSEDLLFLRSFFCGEGVSLGLFEENRGCISIVIFRHCAVIAQRIPTDTYGGVAHPLRSVFRLGMMLVLKIYRQDSGGSRISKSTGSPFSKSRAGEWGTPEHRREKEEHARLS